jgi:hypothetical protein
MNVQVIPRRVSVTVFDGKDLKAEAESLRAKNKALSQAYEMIDELRARVEALERKPR